MVSSAHEGKHGERLHIANKDRVEAFGCLGTSWSAAVPSTRVRILYTMYVYSVHLCYNCKL